MRPLTVRAGDALRPAVLLLDAAVLDLVAARAIIPLAGCVPASMSALLATGGEGLKLVATVAELASAPHTTSAL